MVFDFKDIQLYAFNRQMSEFVTNNAISYYIFITNSGIFYQTRRYFSKQKKQTTFYLLIRKLPLLVLFPSLGESPQDTVMYVYCFL